jgi:hypothetical protein
MHVKGKIKNLFNNLYLQKLGSFGRVRLAKDKAKGEYVALKMLKKAEILRLK